MGILPSAERLAALGLAIAGLTILGLAFLVLSDLAREGDLHREVIRVQQEQDTLEALRVRLSELLRGDLSAGEIAALARPLEPSLRGALRGHEHMFARPSPRALA